jgi:hypothetical protein
VTLGRFEIATWRIRLLCLGAVGTAVAAVFVTSAPATPPGKNGRIAFARYAQGQPGGEPSGGLIFSNPFGKLKDINGVEWIEVGAISVIDADGSNRTQLTQLQRPTSSEDLMGSAGSRIRQLTRTARWDSAPDWGPAR